MATDRIIENEFQRDMLILLLKDKKLPFTVSIANGKRRSVDQNKLQRLWIKEISDQRGDMTPEEVRGYCKLTIGVPILRDENEEFREKYDKNIKGLPYEQKMAFMMEPLDFPITRLMTTRQKTNYLDGIHRHFSERGIVLTDPAGAAHQKRAA